MSGHTPNIFDALRPLLIFSTIFGLYPNKIKSEPDKKHLNSINVIGILWSIFIVVSLTTYSVCTIQRDEQHASNNELIIQVGDIIYMTVSLINSCVITVNSIITSKKFVVLLEKLNDFDRRIHHLGVPCDIPTEYVAARNYTIVANGTVIFLLSFYIFIDMFLFVDKITFTSLGAQVVVYVYPLTAMMIVILQFATMALLVKQKFKWINLKLLQVRDAWHSGVKENSVFRSPGAASPIFCQSASLTEKTVHALESLRRKHYELCSICGDLNGIFDFPILTTALNLFIAITFTVYFYFISNSRTKIEHPVLYSAYYVLNGFINCCVLLVMVHSSSRTKVEANSTSDILHTIQDRNEEVDTFVTHFSFQLLQYGVEFSACRVFVLDETLLFSVVGALTTYLVIVVQFQYQN